LRFLKYPPTHHTDLCPRGHLSSTDLPCLHLTAHFLAVNVPFLFFKLGRILISRISVLHQNESTDFNRNKPGLHWGKLGLLPMTE